MGRGSSQQPRLMVKIPLSHPSHARLLMYSSHCYQGFLPCSSGNSLFLDTTTRKTNPLLLWFIYTAHNKNTLTWFQQRLHSVASIPCPGVLTSLWWGVSSCRLGGTMETVQRRAALCCVGDGKGDLLDLHSHPLCSTSSDYRAVTPHLDCLDSKFTSKLHPCSSWQLGWHSLLLTKHTLCSASVNKRVGKITVYHLELSLGLLYCALQIPLSCIGMELGNHPLPAPISRGRGTSSAAVVTMWWEKMSGWGLLWQRNCWSDFELLQSPLFVHRWWARMFASSTAVYFPVVSCSPAEKLCSERTRCSLGCV